jgi:hypothetical protein
VLDDERMHLSADPLGWAVRWAAHYGARNEAQDRELYWPYFFDSFQPDDRRLCDAAAQVPDPATSVPRARLHLHALARWKYGARDWRKPYERAAALFASSDDVPTMVATIEREYSSGTTLVSRIFWLHVLDPVAFPIFDQRSLRSFCLLARGVESDTDEPHLWLGGPPTGKRCLRYYHDVFQPLLQQATADGSAGSRLLKLRCIDRALFGFDRAVTGAVISRPPSVPARGIADMIDRRIERAREK